MITPDKAGEAKSHLYLAFSAAVIADAMSKERPTVSPGMAAAAEHHTRLLDFHFRRAALLLGFDVVEQITAQQAHELALQRMRECEGDAIEDIVGR